mgnify:CR=1 FL=1
MAELAQVAAAVEKLLESGSLEEAERPLETNTDAAALHLDLAYALSSLQLLRQKAAAELRKDDPALRQMKKIQERSGRLAQMRQKAAGEGSALAKREKRAV